MPALQIPPAAARPSVPPSHQPRPSIRPAERPSAAPPRRAPAERPAPAAPPTRKNFYGLQERPFSLTCDLRFLYHSAGYNRAAQAMLDAIRRRDGIALLTGAPGVGKTMLCEGILEQLDRRTLTSLVANPLVSPEELLKKVLLDFGVISAADLSKGRLAHATRADLLTALRDFLYTLPPLEAFAVVVVDEAHNMSADLLGQIRVLADSGGDVQLLQVMLVGQPALTSARAHPELRTLFQRVSVRSTLGPLAAEEVGDYIAHRLSVAGASTPVLFDEAAALRVHQVSGGVPRVVNQVCERALAAGEKAAADTIDVSMVDEAAADLDLAPPVAKTSIGARMAAVVLLFALVIVGAAAGAFVFRSQVTAWLEQWQAQPALPARPPLPLPTPYVPTPADAAELAAGDQPGGLN